MDRLKYILLTIITIILGLLSRKFTNIFPLYIGDILWATMVYFILRSIFIKNIYRNIVLYTLIFSYTIELSQLYKSPWINKIRSIRLFGLILGYGFLWSDLIYYAIGACIGFLVDYAFTNSTS
ncbi:MAG: DUF2809 domain-containing protein [Anaeromicrobium sp.]|jgi:hypothetical protein|uniref:ribosomal maturation YjgA family protein n=1 Tax=Anaeromicrobium sp. TaxID=1929132 RepID=UPI0025DE5D02|nr:DUF2809 domain-containing protein [Anaeromicrobium sp.]MCT4594144.1 DUF2809 domain-containing protein [Anaeromicrobium sp.]